MCNSNENKSEPLSSVLAQAAYNAGNKFLVCEDDIQALLCCFMADTLQLGIDTVLEEGCASCMPSKGDTVEDEGLLSLSVIHPIKDIN